MPKSDPSSRDELAIRRVGQLLSGKWKLERLLGVGGMAAVYAAEHRNGTRAAIKLFRPGFIADPGMHQRFLREGYLANRVGHPAVVRVFDDHVDERDGSAYLVMELIEGESLQQWLEREKRLPPAEVLLLADQLLDVLEMAHEHGVVHRDLKPENIIVVPSGFIRVLDFGIARDIKGDPTTTYGGLTMGTPAFMAPEQALGKSGQIDGRTDLYAVGAMMFSLLTGEHIHQGETVQELVLRAAWFHARKLREVWPEAPEALARIIDRACAYDREARFADAKEMRTAVEAMIDSQPSDVRRVALRPPTPVPAPEPSATSEQLVATLSQGFAADAETSAPGFGGTGRGEPATPTLQSPGDRRSTSAPVRLEIGTALHREARSKILLRWGAGIGLSVVAIATVTFVTRAPSRGTGEQMLAAAVPAASPRFVAEPQASAVPRKAVVEAAVEPRFSASPGAPRPPSTARTSPLPRSAERPLAAPAAEPSASTRAAGSAPVPVASGARRDIGY
jgi:serine/threonine protein kinase